MKKRYIKILEYLEQSDNDFVNGRELASLFNVTTRTIRNDIREINESYLEKLIIVGNNQKGYKLVGDLSNIHQNEEMKIIVKTIVSFAKELNIKTIAEFFFKFFCSWNIRCGRNR